MPPQKALTYFARAAHYYEDSSEDNPGYIQVNKTLGKLHLVWQFSDTHMHYACNALLAGDETAAAGFMQPDSEGQDCSLADLLSRYRDLRWSVYMPVERDPNKQKAIKPLESELGICQKAYGEHGETLAAILSRLAECYRIAGENQKAITTYKRLVSMTRKGSPENDRQLLAYVDLLSQNGQAKLVPKILEMRLEDNGKLDTSSPLFIRLIEAYSAGHMNQQAQDALAELIETPQAVKYDPKYRFVEPTTAGSPQTQEPIYRNTQAEEDLLQKRQLDPFAAGTQPTAAAESKAISSEETSF
jgi:tetratricopeptide (TPR) repeat protein